MSWTQTTSPDVATIGAQPVDSDLTAVAALATTSYGRSLLALADAAAGQTALGLGTAALSASGDFQPTDADLTAIAALTTTAYGRGLLALADSAAVASTLGWGVMAPLATQTTFQPHIAGDSGGNVSTSGVLHACYLGYTTQPIVIKHVRCVMTAVMGSANQIGEFALFSSPLAPQSAGQTLTCLAVAADANITTWTVGAGVKTNTADFVETIPAGTHVWAGIRTACTGGTGTQPTWRRCFPTGEGMVLWGAASGTVVKGNDYVCAASAFATQPPFIYATLW